MNHNQHPEAPKHTQLRKASPSRGFGSSGTAARSVKTAASVLLTIGIVPAVTIAQDAKPEMFGTWKLNWERTSANIRTVPSALKQRFKEVEEFREFVGNQAKGMTIEILPEQKGFVQCPPDYASTNYRWRSGDGSTYWFYSLASAVSHGFKMIDGNRATVLLQIDREGKAVVRIPVLFERQPESPQKSQ
jgi:hypothetical protein